jgi:hypothetical protein
MIAVLLPVLGRAKQIEIVLNSLAAATTNPYRAILICSPGDEALEAARASTAETIITTWRPDRADYAKKLSLGYRSTTEEWLFQGATDLIFHAGWDAWALRAARQHHCGVIGTNDLGNPLVLRGISSTHSLISRDYLDRYGGTIDDSGGIFSEQYDHQWTDCEFVETARRRRQFYFCRRSIVEHMHPHWGKAESDATYEKALRSTKQDQRLFMQRRRLYQKLK